WQNQGGGPWGGGGGGGPWGGGRGPTGPGQPPNLEELLRKAQDGVRRFLPGGFGGAGAAAVLGVIFLLWLASGIYKVQADEQGVVLRFGEWTRTTQPGLNYHLPY